MPLAFKIARDIVDTQHVAAIFGKREPRREDTDFHTINICYIFFAIISICVEYFVVTIFISMFLNSPKYLFL